jgi:hypothetical protein
MCRFHDALFESGYLSLADDLNILKKQNVTSSMLKRVLDATVAFKLPNSHQPLVSYLREHRQRTGFPI